MLPLYDDQPARRFPFATVLIIAANTAVFCAWQIPAGIKKSAVSGGLVPAVFLHSPWLPAMAQMISSMFMHGGWMHLIVNMWFLWVFGKSVEGATGHAQFAVFYFLCGIVAGCAYVFSSAGSQIPVVGASGAISGVLGGYLVLYPKASLTALAPYSMRLPAWFFLIVWFGLQVLYQFVAASGGHSGGDVAYLAHIGGFPAGLILIFFFKNRTDSLGSDAQG